MIYKLIKNLASKLVKHPKKNTSLKTTDLIVILGASDNPSRPSFMANKLLENKGYRTLKVTEDQNSEIAFAEADKNKTVTIFLKPRQQKKYYDYVLSLNPSRIIFNPGTENDELIALAAEKNIKVDAGCTIAMLLNSLL